MKVSIDIDCTPEEARTFFGLPDLVPVHSAYVERLKQFVTDGLSVEEMTKTVGQWMPTMEGGVEAWLASFQKLFGAPKSGG